MKLKYIGAILLNKLLVCFCKATNPGMPFFSWCLLAVPQRTEIRKTVYISFGGYAKTLYTVCINAFQRKCGVRTNQIGSYKHY